MKRTLALFLFLFAFVSPLHAQFVEHARVQTERPELRKRFAAFRAEGTFVLYALRGDSCIRYNPERAKARFLPASTFKIFNTMAALEAGSIPDDSTIIKWDGIERHIKGWDQDQDMRTAFRNSTVWFYQELARRTGSGLLHEMMVRENYGNADTTGGVDAFWLMGGLRISANEQADFLVKLYHRTLSFPMRAQNTVYRIMLLEQEPDYTLRGKTGWTEQNGNQLGWLVGFLERKEETFVFALNLESQDADFPMQRARIEILKGILGEMGLLHQ